MKLFFIFQPMEGPLLSYEVGKKSNTLMLSIQSFTNSPTLETKTHWGASKSPRWTLILAWGGNVSGGSHLTQSKVSSTNDLQVWFPFEHKNSDERRRNVISTKEQREKLA